MHMNSKMGQRKNQNPPRRHGEDQNQFSPERTQRSRTTTKTILYHRGHERTRREPKPKLTAEVAKEGWGTPVTLRPISPHPIYCRFQHAQCNLQGQYSCELFVVGEVGLLGMVQE